jgi:dTDP-4-dehydrorhamnose reductase
LAKVVAQYCHVRGLVTAQSPDRLARGDEATLDSLLTSLRPAAIVHVSPLTHSERAPEGSIAQLRSCVREAVMAAEAACRHGLPLVCISSYRVFSASRDEAFTELDPPNPACLVGGLFRRLEQRVASSCPHALLMRVGELLDPESTADPLAGALVAIRSGCQVVADDRLRFTPAMIHDVASAALDLLIDGESGYWHLANTGEADSLALLRHVATLCGLDDQLAVGRPTTSHHEVRRVLIDSVRGRVLPPLDDAIHRYARQVARHLTAIDAHERERSHAPRQGNTIGILAMTSDPTNTVEAVEVL